jgi:tRNA(fMet)-specific endonuclease VapC
MMQRILDTSTCVFYLRGKLDFNRFVAGSWRESCCISEITVLELRCGAENSSSPQKHQQNVDALLKGLAVIPVATCTAAYAKEKVRLRKLGKPVNDEFDLIIGTTAIAAGLTLVTDNVKHFKDFEDIKIENWMVNQPER